ncbi:hypothetical protein [Rosenbergiella epipactidis]|uniref:hypothetical protein n=1 Tax=Rosenbergiella epipactidis TaxID=1544694 RepID=UPI001F500E33|nr:hypothetical protein [Rosenbergiella epipactidis]
MKKMIAALLCMSSLTGCATIVGEDTQMVRVNSSPSNTSFIIKDEQGFIIAQGATPQAIMLPKSDGSYFGKKSYLITFSKEGYAPVTFPITASANGWYIAGNIVFGGLIGWLGVDPFNGGMYTLKPKSLSPIMAPQAK